MSSFDPSNWMGKMPSSFHKRKIDEVILPGSWQSGAYRFNSDFLGNSRWASLIKIFPSFLPWMEKYLRYHNQTIFQQLRGGVRYLDFRVSYCQDTKNRLLFRTGYYLTSYFNCLPLEEALSQVSNFLYSHPLEVVLVEISTDDTITDPNDLLKIITSTNWKYLMHHNRENCRFYATIDQMVRLGQRLVVFLDRDASAYRDIVWPAYLIQCNKNEIATAQEKKSELIRYLNTCSFICHLPWVLRPSYFGYLSIPHFPCTGFGYRQVANDFNREFLSFLQENEQLILRKARIISFVWWEQDILVRMVAELNYKLLPRPPILYFDHPTNLIEGI